MWPLWNPRLLHAVWVWCCSWTLQWTRLSSSCPAALNQRTRCCCTSVDGGRQMLASRLSPVRACAMASNWTLILKLLGCGIS